MAETNHPSTHSVGIYHGLPEFSILNQTAIVTGSNGLSGQAMLKILLAHPDRWTNIYAISQGPPLKGGYTAKHVHHIAVNFLADSEEVGRVLRENGVKKGYCFFFSYKESADPAVMYAENGEIEDFSVDGEECADWWIATRIVLQTGGKHYGVHQGPYSIPAEEDDPRLDLGPNFYYRQEDILNDLGAKYGFDYAVTRPMTIIGALKGNYLNLAIALGLYLSVTKELGDTPVFNGTLTKYHSAEALSSSTLNAYFAEWCALTPACSNQAFNITNGDVSVWARLFPTLCTDFSLPAPSPTQFTSPPLRPFKAQFPTVRPLDRAEKGTIELRNSWVQWAQEERTLEAWKRLAKREGLQEDAFERASWGYADRNMGIGYGKLEAMGKARRLGWLGYVDSTNNFLGDFAEGQAMTKAED
ncbi:hypothetical protein L207DRAFT_636273 [Hyaloscypha variabilis F]|uniref:PRISE-like Rossmann-fold domain-containing protein n=1 Tax=Hyaloscypha variabilis (strain UAMH 11265 / GT02V1 / F) TaxID=1149755 RepID=A0A2J6RGI0_HYAVF|nr:hypothetical protein L207DRAFT_636273 [Hyaloscypha variabilis F]